MQTTSNNKCSLGVRGFLFLSTKVLLFRAEEGEYRRTFIQIPRALPFSRNNRKRIFTDTIRLSANSLIALADRIRKPADTIRKLTGNQSSFFTPRSQKNGKKASFPQKSSRFQLFLNKKNGSSHTHFPAFLSTLRFSPLPSQRSFINFS